MQQLRTRDMTNRTLSDGARVVSIIDGERGMIVIPAPEEMEAIPHNAEQVVVLWEQGVKTWTSPEDVA